MGFQKPLALSIGEMCEYSTLLLERVKAESRLSSDEIAGVIFQFDELVFMKMENLAEDKSSNFKIDPKVILLKDKIHSIFHSHPQSDAHPSEKDKDIFRNHAIPLLIYSCIYDNFVFFNEEGCKPIKV